VERGSVVVSLTIRCFAGGIEGIAAKLFFSVFIGIGLVSREVERRTIFTLLSKPVRRAEFLMGKFLGSR